MLGPIRKFSSSIYAKILLFIVVIPFVFWGMGPVFQSGKQNIIVEIGKEKISTQEFIDYIKSYTPPDQTIDSKLIERLLSSFIGEKLIIEEIEYFDIRLSDNSLVKIIKNEDIFKRENKFSRVEYEKFLIKNNLDPASFESITAKQIKKEQLFNIIGED